VCIDRSFEYVIAVLGALKANCFVLPLPPSYPDARLRDIVLVRRAAGHQSPTRRARVHGLSSATALDIAELARESSSLRRGSARSPTNPHSCSAPPVDRASEDDRESSRSFFHRLRWTWESHPFDAADVCVQKSHMTTTHAIYELFEPLLRGVPTHILSDDDVRHLDRFWQLVRERRVTRLLVVPSMLQTSLDTTAVDVPDLTMLVLMGERLPPRLAGRALTAFGADTRIYSIYGSTEASSVLVCDVRAGYRPDRELALGEPIAPEVQAAVLDESLAPVAPGTAGMLFIAGPALFEEYYKDPQLTTANVAMRAGVRWYRTQDEVRRAAGGELEFVGRVDDTVKVRGFRVDLRDVERTIAAHREVGSCVVLPTSDEGGSSALVAFITPSGVSGTAVLQHARSALPSHMVPAAVVCLDTLPLTPSGKVDRRRLLAEYSAPVGAPDASPGPRPSERWQRCGAGCWGMPLWPREQLSRGGRDIAHGVRRRASPASRVSARRACSRTSRSTSIRRSPAWRRASRTSDPAAPCRLPATPVLVTLKQGTDRALQPLFAIASAGGTLGRVREAGTGARESPRDDRGSRSIPLGRPRSDAGIRRLDRALSRRHSRATAARTFPPRRVLRPPGPSAMSWRASCARSVITSACLR
jgi:hypothetical protein